MNSRRGDIDINVVVILGLAASSCAPKRRPMAHLEPAVVFRRDIPRSMRRVA